MLELNLFTRGNKALLVGMGSAMLAPVLASRRGRGNHAACNLRACRCWPCRKGTVMLYPPPDIIEAEIHARLPDRFRVQGLRSTWGAWNKSGAVLHSFLEGPSFDRDGNLYLVDIPWGRIFRVSPS